MPVNGSLRNFATRFVLLTIVLIASYSSLRAVETPTTTRTPPNDTELRYWLQNMLGAHRFSREEVSAATGLTAAEIDAALDRLDLHPAAAVLPQGQLFVLPYPGGRHPRIGFLEGAIDPQRETKVSVFTPWQDPAGAHADYVVVDVPEALWSNLGLTYLAHTHVPTVWTKQGVELPPHEWNRHDDGSLDIERRLPNGIGFTSLVVPCADHVRMTLTLTNGTSATLTDLRVQNCVMLKEARGFAQQTNENKHQRPPYIACDDEDGRRWIITGWTPLHRTWGNERCPCVHADPKFPDCPPGETVRVDGWLSFFTGEDIDGELNRIDETRWWEPKTR